MAKYKTPGVYIQEIDAFGNSVIPVPTAIPVFVGYTGRTTFNGESVINKAIKINSLSQYFTFFGETLPPVQFNLAKIASGGIQDSDFQFGNPPENFIVTPAGTIFRMDAAMKFFYANGGADCYIMSVGGYDVTPSVADITEAIDLLKNETEPTMLLVPDAIEFSTGILSDPLATQYAGAYSILSKMINHCGADMQSRVAILDVPGGYITPDITGTPIIDAFRMNVNPILPKSNSYAAAYYPWLHTTIYQSSEISIKQLTNTSLEILQIALNNEFPDPIANKKNGLDDLIASLTKVSTTKDDLEKADEILRNVSKFYPLVLDSILKKLNLIAPSTAMAGIFTAVDNSDGVWKAPANVAVQNVIEPAVKIDHDAQEDLNVPIGGKSICAIRSFPGSGVLVWGARTLDGNSNDWRYINVRRTLIYIEQSVKDAAKAYVFATNDATTWVNIESMIGNFLTGLWRQGGLVGAKPTDAFFVNVGLGTTMTNDDILNGKMIVSIGVAISHPAEFIIVTFQQQMQKA